MLPALRKQKSITQSLSPVYRKASQIQLIKTPQPTSPLKQQYSQIESLISKLQQIMDARMSLHQKQLLSIMKIEIAKILSELETVVKVYNKMIEEKNYSQDLWECRNQVDYFRSQAIKFYEENKQLKEELVQKSKELQKIKIDQRSQEGAMKRMAKKLAKVKSKADREFASLGHISQTDIQGLYQDSSLVKQKMKIDEKALVTDIEVSLNKIKRQSKAPQNITKSVIPSTNRNTPTNILTELQKSVQFEQRLSQMGSSQRVTLLNSPTRQQKMKIIKHRPQFYRF